MLQGSFRVLRAFFYIRNVTTNMRRKIQLRTSTSGGTEFFITPVVAVFGDPFYGYTKTMAVAYQFRGQSPRLVVGIERAEMPGDNSSPAGATYAPVNGIAIYGAYYGPADVTTAVVEKVMTGVVRIQADNSVFGETWAGNSKVLVILYRTSQGVDTLAAAGPGDCIVLG